MAKPQSRNALCSCGSKKKFKRCCGKRGAIRTTPSADPSTEKSQGAGIPLLPIFLGLVVIVGLSIFIFKDALFDSNVDSTPVGFTQAQARNSHSLMIDALKEIGKSAEVWHPYLGDSELNQIRKIAERNQATATPDQRCDLHFLAGLQEGRLGNLRDAIRDIKAAYDMLPDTSFEEGKKSYITFKLGVAFLRLGETENCCVQGGPESCIVPIGPAGVHTQKEGSENAIKYFLEVLQSGEETVFARKDANPNSANQVRTHQAAMWLLNVAHMTLGSYPDGVPEEFLVPETAFQTKTDFPKFKNVAGSLGLDTFDLCGGVICDDFDNDGYLDIVTSTWDPNGQLNYFHNQGDGTFSNKTEQAGLSGIYGGLNISQADFNNDGHLDVLLRVAHGHVPQEKSPTRCFATTGMEPSPTFRLSPAWRGQDSISRLRYPNGRTTMPTETSTCSLAMSTTNN